LGKLSDSQIRAWISAGKPISGRSDGGGLTFTLALNGVAAWVLRYRYGGRQRELHLGRYPALSLKDARKRALEERARIQKGIDVAAAKQRERAARKRAGTLEELAEDYMLRAGPALASSTQEETRRYLTKDILPMLGKRPVREIGPGEIVDLIERIAERSSTVARRAFELLSVMFAHGIAKHMADTNPCAMLRVSAIVGAKAPPRARLKLTEDELRAFLAALPQLGPQLTLAFRVLLATCVRKSELRLARWSEVDFVRGAWEIPAGHSKTRRGFVIPLAPSVVHWMRSLKTLSAGSPCVLASPVKLNEPMSEATLNAALKRLDVDIRRFSPHDLRSTARSYLAQLGVDIIIAERCLNHSLGGLVAVYDQHDYMEERRAALEKWAAFLEELEKPR
jgi:integrase